MKTFSEWLEENKDQFDDTTPFIDVYTQFSESEAAVNTTGDAIAGKELPLGDKKKKKVLTKEEVEESKTNRLFP